MLGKFLPLLAALSIPAHASEDDYNRAWCKAMNGELVKGQNYEVPVKGGRADCVTETYAVEMDFASKWRNCYSQAQWYGQQLNKRPGCVLIVGPGDEKYLDYLDEYLYREDKYLKVWTVAK